MKLSGGSKQNKTLLIHDDHISPIPNEAELTEVHNVHPIIEFKAKKIGKTVKKYLNKNKIGIILLATDFFKALIEDGFIGNGIASYRSDEMTGILMKEYSNPEEYFDNLIDPDEMLSSALNYTHVHPHKMFDLKKNKLHWEETNDGRISEYSIYYTTVAGIFDMLDLLYIMCSTIYYDNNKNNYVSQIDFERTYRLLKKSRLFKSNDNLKNIPYLMKICMSIITRIYEGANKLEDSENITIPIFLDSLTIRFLIPKLSGKTKRRKRKIKNNKRR
tara:strand:+ start:89 stop:910 length:822 start_codon:yes stop_codon:yes gene_type:complete